MLTRRHLLKQFGIHSALLPFLPVLEQETLAQSAPTLRFMTFFHPHGGLFDRWDESLAKFDKVKSKTLVFKGVSVNSGNINGASGGHHFHQAAAVFSGSENSTASNLANGASIDQVVAQQMPLSASIPSLVLGIMCNETSIRGRISHSGPAKPITPEQSPQNLFNQIFQGVIPSLALTATETNSYEKSVLDHVYQDLNRLKAKVSQANYQHMNAMMESIRALENRFSDEIQQKSADCRAPDLDSGQGLDQALDNFMAIISHAFQCNLVQVVSLQALTSMVTQSVFGHIGITERLHALSHADAGQSVPDAHNKMTKVVSYFYEKMAGLAESLEVQDGATGRTVLDNTLILTGSELGMNSALRHGSQNMPYVMIGGAGGRLNTGQVLHVNASNNQVLLTAARAMGLNIDSFGTLDNGRGPVNGALA